MLNITKICSTVYDFCKILKMREIKSLNPRIFSVIVLFCIKRRCSQIEQQLKVEIEEPGQKITVKIL